ncbi:carbamoyltransferase HypF [Haloimpatiens sp. FM7330]|uniref:carbamoyltransferase HypF n=1 Tax=Haloimpatiens sp. FM7330 TaxID=3298610 RepID=UPI00363A9DB3
MQRLFIKINGIVQGVGFRPFVYNLACSLNLKGWVNNNSEGVYIDIEGSNDNLSSFLNTLKTSPPPLSKIENILITEKKFMNYKTFNIKESKKSKNNITLISPDIATCSECIKDIKDPNNRRYRYPFTNCTNCGPRFSIIKSIPYDRDKTTMKKFKMCNTCFEEYTNPCNRRFHAQPNACSTCGPRVWVTDNKGKKIQCKNPIKYAINSLKEGKIFAIKGLCGFHLVCDASNEQSVELLRKRKIRPDKPFAVMIKDIQTVEKYCYVNDKEKDLLTGIQKPIVLLHRKKEYDLPQNIAPKQTTLGVMLPYTPLHELLFEDNIKTLIMTSANVSGLPLEYKNENALNNLSNLVDYFLLHNRDIYIPVDDSVVKVINNKIRIIRRARGYVPQPLNITNIKNILACGPNMKNTFCISKENFLFLSQYNGDLENLETINHYKRNVEHFKNIFSFDPKYVAYDMHPKYTSTKYAKQYNLPQIPIQHHHAHIVSCMAENKIKEKVLGIAYDGTGYGSDDKIWGGEFLLCTYKNFKRLAHLAYVSLPGGDSAVKEPWKMAVSYIFFTLKSNPNFIETLNKKTSIEFKNLEDLIYKLYNKKGILLTKIIKNNINCVSTSSIGRFFDAASSIIGIRQIISYEGQASIELENIINSHQNNKFNKDLSYDFSIKICDNYIIEPYKIIEEILIDKFNNVPKDVMSLKFHNTIINFSIKMCEILRHDTKINSIALSGGVFQNAYLLTNLTKELQNNGFNVYTHKDIPTNDGGISLGQIIIANENING